MKNRAGKLCKKLSLIFMRVINPNNINKLRPTAAIIPIMGKKIPVIKPIAPVN